MGYSFSVRQVGSQYDARRKKRMRKRMVQQLGPGGTHRGVGPPAHAAAVGLGVLDGVGREVDLQGCRV